MTWSAIFLMACLGLVVYLCDKEIRGMFGEIIVGKGKTIVGILTNTTESVLGRTTGGVCGNISAAIP